MCRRAVKHQHNNNKNLVLDILTTYIIGKNLVAMQSKTIGNDQELIQSFPHPALKTKREITKYINWQQFTKGTRGKPNEQLFPKYVVIQLPKIYKICH